MKPSVFLVRSWSLVWLLVGIGTSHRALGEDIQYVTRDQTPDQFGERYPERRTSTPSESGSQLNWGDAAGGFLLSLGFDDNVVQRGKPIIATVFLRNIMDTTLGYTVSWDEGMHSDICQFSIVGPSMSVLAQTNYPPGTRFAGSRKGRGVEPHEQDKYRARIDNVFDFSAIGDYTITAYKQDFLPIIPGKETRVASAPVTIRIVATNDANAIPPPEPVDQNSSQAPVASSATRRKDPDLSATKAAGNVSSAPSQAAMNPAEKTRRAPSVQPVTAAVVPALQPSPPRWTPRDTTFAAGVSALIALFAFWLWRRTTHR